MGLRFDRVIPPGSVFVIVPPENNSRVNCAAAVVRMGNFIGERQIFLENVSNQTIHTLPQS